MEAIEIIKDWNSKTPEQQLAYCESCVRAAIRDGYRISAGYEIGDAINATYVKIVERLADAEALDADDARRTAAGKAGNTLGSIISRAAKASLEGMSYHSRKHCVATARTITDEDGNEIDRLDLTPANDDTERAAINRAAIKEFASNRDDIDQKIIAGKVNGLTEREIAAIVGISGPAVHKRIAKMRTEITEIVV